TVGAPVGSALVHPDVFEHRDRRRVRATANSETSEVCAGGDWRGTCGSASAGAATRVRRRAATAATAAARRQHRRDERPLHAVNAARRGALRRAQGAPDWIDDRYGDVARD